MKLSILNIFKFRINCLILKAVESLYRQLFYYIRRNPCKNTEPEMMCPMSIAVIAMMTTNAVAPTPITLTARADAHPSITAAASKKMVKAAIITMQAFARADRNVPVTNKRSWLNIKQNF